jgi:dehydrodolichyl diphosphate syntase complex subunit NUS1
MPHIRKAVAQKYNAYFGEYHPGLTITTPHSEDRVDLPAHRRYDGQAGLTVLLISYQDGRESMVDLTKTLAEMSQKGKLSPADINMDLVDAELSEGIMPEPDLLILFGPHVELAGYPPWQVRLTEIFCLPDNQGVGYQVFLRALRNFSDAQFRRGAPLHLPRRRAKEETKPHSWALTFVLRKRRAPGLTPIPWHFYPQRCCHGRISPWTSSQR